MAVAGVVLLGITKVIKPLTVSLEDQQEITQNLQGELSELQSDISDINSEIQTTADRIDELNNKDSLSFVEKEELKNLIVQNDELERTNKLLAEQENQKQQEVAKSVQQEFNKEYNNQRYVRVISEQEANEISQKRERWEKLRLNSGYNTEEEVAEMQRLRQELNEWDSTEYTFVNFTDYIQSVVTAYEDLNQKKKEGSGLSEHEEELLATYRNELVDYAVDLDDYVIRYGIDDETSQSWKDLSALIYECLYPSEYLTQKFNEVFDSLPEGVQSELKQLAENGSLSIDDLSDDIIKKFSEAGFSASEIIEQIQSMLGDLEDSVTNAPSTPLSITETVNQINTRLKSAFDSLRSAYQDIFTLDEDTGEKTFTPLDEADITDKFKPILDALEELDSLDGINVDYSQFEDFVSVLIDTSSTAEDVQEQFNKLATDIIYTSDCTNMSAETFDLLARSLYEMGVTNAYEILGKVRDAQEELAELSYDAERAITEEGKSLTELGLKFEATKEYLRHYLIQKELAENPLSTLEDILQLESLCKALGITGEMYDAVNGLKASFESKENGNHSDGIEKSIQYYQQKLKELARGYYYDYFNFDFEGISSSGAGSSSSSSAKNTIETFDWIEQAIENVEKEIEELDEAANSSYSTFSQKNEALAQEIEKITEEIGLQQQAYDEYMRKADSVALPDHYKQLVQSGAINIENTSDENLQNLINEYQNWYDKAQDVSDAIKQLKTDTKDLYVSAYELQTSNLKDRLDSGSISEKQYLDSLKEAYEKFYADLEDFAEQYHEAVLDYLAEEKDYLNNVAGAAASLIDTEIDNIQDDAKLQEDSIQRQIDLLEAKKKPLQDELEALEDKAKKENLILNLQKAQYDLARAENQKTKLVYTSKGMTYTADPTAIKDAQKGVDDAKLEIRKQSIQDQIDALDDEIDRYHDLIDQINKAADNQIDALEKIKNKWQEVIDQQEYTKNVSLLTGEFGTSAITKLLTGNDDALLAQWKNSYINTLSSLDMENQGYISDMTSLMASLYGVNLSPVQEQFRNVNDSINGMTASLGRAASAIGPGINVPTYNTDVENSTSPTNLTDSITGVGIAADQSLPGVSYNMDDIADTAANAALEVSTVANAIDNIPEYKDVTISIHTVGGNVSGGMSPNVSQIAYTDNAYAAGTDTAERITTRSGATLRPLQPGDKMYDLVQKFDTYMSSMGNKVEAIAQNAAYEQSRQMNEAARQITNSNIINNHNQPGVMVGDVHITCPGVTSQEVAKQVGTELNNIFSGLSLKAYQMANITR